MTEFLSFSRFFFTPIGLLILTVPFFVMQLIGRQIWLSGFIALLAVAGFVFSIYAMSSGNGAGSLGTIVGISLATTALLSVCAGVFANLFWRYLWRKKIGWFWIAFVMAVAFSSILPLSYFAINPVASLMSK